MKMRKLLAATCAAALCISATGMATVGSSALTDILSLTAHAEDGIPIDEEHFPDEIFRQSILDELDTDKNGSLSTEEAAVATSLQCGSENITSLKGIEYFTELTLLDCSNNQLTELDVSKNTALTYLSCNSNLLTKLDVSGCTSLDFLNCLHNNLEELDVRECAVLKHLYCNSNQFTELDVSKNILLEDLDCCDNKIIELDISNCPNIILAYTTGEDANVWNYPYGVFGKLYKENGSIRYTIYADEDTKITTEPKADGVAIDEINFPDENFRAYVSENFDTDTDGKLSTQEIYVVDSIYVARKNITSLKGVEYFVELKTLNCAFNSLTELDVSKNVALIELDCSNNKLASLDISNNNDIYYFSCENNQLGSLILGDNDKISYFYCENNQLTSLDISKCTSVGQLDCRQNKLTSLVIGSKNGLGVVYCSDNELTALDISGVPKIQALYCSHNKIAVLDISNCQMLIDCYNGNLTEKDGVLYYGWGLTVDKTTKLITDPNEVPEEVEIGTANVPGTAKNPNVDITDMGITFEDESGETYTAQVQADGTIMLPSLPAGEYTVTASLENCPSRDYTVTVESGKPVEIEVELKLYGDVNGDGKASTADLSKINEQVQKLSELSEYDNKVADVNGDGKVTTSDLSKINEHVQQLKLMW